MIDLILALVDDAPHPQLSGDASWVGVMLILIFGLIFAATAVGIALRANAAHDDSQPK